LEKVQRQWEIHDPDACRRRRRFQKGFGFWTVFE
jgi:hypothetical protein